MAKKHGFKTSSGWIFFTTFSIVQVIGGCCYLATLHNPQSKALYIASIVCSSMGMSPLTMACISLLSRANSTIESTHRVAFSNYLFKATHLICAVAMILGIVAMTENSDISQALTNEKLRITLILFLLAWIGLLLLLVLVGSRYIHIARGEHRLLLAVGLSLPPLLVRLIYSFMNSFSNDQSFSMIWGNPTVMLCMKTLEQMFIVLVCLGIGMTLYPRPPDVASGGHIRNKRGF
ncbi:uncharacterized protein ATNIH1004_008409 [Aspergillus tanneri]|nr:uncharacterized protein ATNIH1004_008409 [Aspergillus tanneri]KAA8644210.1 hypothetical protein ATNIH1004_008409 [Aspergillus tanneri]